MSDLWLNSLVDIAHEMTQSHVRYLKVCQHAIMILDRSAGGSVSVEKDVFIDEMAPSDAPAPRIAPVASNTGRSVIEQPSSPVVQPLIPASSNGMGEDIKRNFDIPVKVNHEKSFASSVQVDHDLLWPKHEISSGNLNNETTDEKQNAKDVVPVDDFIALMLDVVAEKTGYPLDLLDLGMDIETDLGIDSIKRVEILSGIQEKIPNLPEVDLTEVASLRTLGEIADYIEKHAKEMMTQGGLQQAGVSSPMSVTQPAVAQPAVSQSTASQSATSVTTSIKPEEFLNILLEVVADKTGYPVDLLEPNMDIETDLGIDSIKKVEILSGIQEMVPDLPEINLQEVSSLRTIGEIAEYLKSHGMV